MNNEINELNKNISLEEIQVKSINSFLFKINSTTEKIVEKRKKQKVTLSAGVSSTLTYDIDKKKGIVELKYFVSTFNAPLSVAVDFAILFKLSEKKDILEEKIGIKINSKNVARTSVIKEALDNKISLLSSVIDLDLQDPSLIIGN